MTYVEAIREGFDYLLANHPDVIVMGQGLWSPFYVGRSMNGLDEQYGKDRVMDTPVAENCVTGVGLGAAIAGMRPVVVHPRLDFMILATDQVVNEAAKWQSVLGGGATVPLTVRGIINRGGEQGAQHSQALHAWFAHIPGLKVVMPATPCDARDLLIAAVLSDDPVIYIDDRWCYGFEEECPPAGPVDLDTQGAKQLRDGTDVTLVGIGYSTHLCVEAAQQLADAGVSAAVVDIRVLRDLELSQLFASVRATGRLIVVDGGWRTAGMASEIVATVAEEGIPLVAPPRRVTIADAPAPTSKPLEAIYYPTADQVVGIATAMVKED